MKKGTKGKINLIAGVAGVTGIGGKITLKSESDIMSEHHQMHEALKYYQKGIDHFYKCINFGKSNLDAEAIVFMNDSNIKISNVLKLIK